MTRSLLSSFGLLLLALHSVGCSQTWHQKFDWNAAQFFEDSQVIELCKAIEANDVAEIDRLIAAGVDVNTTGKGNMTPLLWALPDKHFESFKRLLEHGADPNVIIDKKLIPPKSAWRGNDSVTHMVCRTVKEGYFEAVFENGGDVNLKGGDNGETPIFVVIREGIHKAERIKTLIELGANLNHKSSSGATPAMVAVGYFAQYGLALQILEAGADPKLYSGRAKLTHSVAMAEKRLSSLPEKARKEYASLVDWLESHGESVQAAHDDFKRWDEWTEKYEPKERKKLYDQEIADRLQREAEGR